MTTREGERWFDVYDALRRRTEQASSAEVSRCPSCGASEVHVLWVGDPATRVGFAHVWCEACRRGLRLSRVAIPTSAPMLRFDQPEKAPAILDQITWVDGT